jgi:membrane associated rhomboid family serine protease
VFFEEMILYLKEFMSKNAIKYHPSVIWIPLISLVTIWFIYFIEIKFGFNLNKYGIYPKTFTGLRGIIFSPFIHSSTKHLLNNSLPLVVLMAATFYFYRSIAYKVLIAGTLIAGMLTWSFARPSYHIGASGVIYLLVSFIFFSGVFRKYYRLIALSLAVVFWYGSMIWYIFPIKERISWEGHLSGFLTGLLLAYLYKRRGPQQESFQFTPNDEFEAMFDEDGNFNPKIEEASDNEIEEELP